MTSHLGWRFRVMIAVLAVTAYAPTLKIGFLWDDHVTVEGNASLQQWSLANLRQDFSSDIFAQQGDPYYRPVASLVSRVDYTLWKLRPFGYHLTNVLIHVGNALLVAELILALELSALTAMITGTLFAVHPIVVEQLMIVSGRAELMGLLFPLIALLLFLKNDKRSIAWGWAAYLAGLFSKESAIMTPFLIALVYYVRREPRAKYRRIIPMLGAIPVYLWLRYQAVGPAIPENDLWLTTRFFVQEFPHVIWIYLRLLLVPWNLHSHRLLPHLNRAWPLYLITLGAAMYYGVKTYQRLAIFCIGWFLLMLLPKTLPMIYGNLMLDHWVYPAAVAFFLPLAGAITWGWRSRKEAVRAFTAFVYFGALIVWALLVHLNVALRGTDEQMYRWALHFTSSNPIKYNLGVLLLTTNRPEEATHYLEDYRTHYPEDPRALSALALAYQASGQPGLALRLVNDFRKTYPPHAMVEHTWNVLKTPRPRPAQQ